MKKKIFITIPWFSPAYQAGGPIQSVYNMVANIYPIADLYIYTSNVDLDKSILDVETDKWIGFENYAKVWYASKGNISQNLTEQVEWVKPDIIFIIGMYSWHFTLVPVFFTRITKKIISPRGMLHPGALSQKSRKKELFLFLMRKFGLQNKVSFHATDETEAGFIRKHFGNNASVHIATNIPRSFGARSLKVKSPSELIMISIALISPMKNHLSVLRALRHCRARIQYIIAGPIKDQEYWNECLKEIRELPSNITVDIAGQIKPSEIIEWLDKAQVFILPSKSENYGHAIIEALNAGLPVISSKNVPWTGLEASQAGINLEPDEISLSKAIQFYAEMENETYQQWSRSAVSYSRKQVDVEAARRAFKEMFELSQHDNEN